jgi:hypothetical protein
VANVRRTAVDARREEGRLRVRVMREAMVGLLLERKRRKEWKRRSSFRDFRIGRREPKDQSRWMDILIQNKYAMKNLQVLLEMSRRGSKSRFDQAE